MIGRATGQMAKGASVAEPLRPRDRLASFRRWRPLVVLAGAIALGSVATEFVGRLRDRGRTVGVSIALSGDGRMVAFTTCGSEARPLPGNRIYGLDVVSRRVRVLVDDEFPVTCPVLSADGDLLAYSRLTSSGDVTVVRSLARNRVLLVTPASHGCRVPAAFPPGGRYIVESRAGVRRRYSLGGFVWDSFDLWLVDIAGGRERRLTSGRFAEVDRPTFLRDGRTMAYLGRPHASPGLSTLLYTQPFVLTGSPTEVARLGADVRWLGQTQDSRLGYWRSLGYDERMGLTHIAHDGSGETAACRLWTPRVAEARWSSDGRRVVVLEDLGGTFALTMLDPETCARQRLGGPELFEDPLGRRTPSGRPGP